MCYDSGARPPLLPIAGGASYGEDIVLTGADGNRFAVYIAHPEVPKGPQVIVLPDVRGLHQFYKELALRFSEAGIAALAIDYFGRTAKLSPRDDSFEFRPHVEQLQLQTISADIDAAFTHLQTGQGDGLPVFTVGFCMGGALALISGMGKTRLTGVIGLYAVLTRARFGSQATVLDRAGEIACPVLGLFGGADQAIPTSAVETLDQTLDKTGVQHEIIIYPNAPHGFFDRRATEFAKASADAWQRILYFITAHAPEVAKP